jgi:NAD-dependent DNA ligase
MVTIIASLSFKNTGWSTAKQIAKLFEGKQPDWSGLSYAAYSPFLNQSSEEYKTVIRFIETLKSNGFKIEEEEQKQITSDTITFEMTGSPKEFGFKTKDEFIKTVSAKGFVHTPLQKGTKYLITDDLQSDSSKMSKAKKLGIEIITYTQALNM